MAIYLDSNAMHRWHTFAELNRVAISTIARQKVQSVFVPWLVFEELRGQYERHLTETRDRLRTAIVDATSTFDEQGEFGYDPEPDIDGQLASWKERFREFAGILEPHHEDVVEAFRREVNGIAPARRERGKPGIGGRDAAIWLSIVRDYNERGEDGHFVTSDRGFGASDGKLRSPMSTDVAGGTFQVYRGVDEFLAGLGTFTPIDLGVEDLADAVRSVKVVLPFTPHIPNAVFREHFSDDYRFQVEIVDARPTRVLDTRAYTRDDTGLAVVNSEWELDVNLFYRRRDADDSTLWQGWNDLEVTGTIQLYVPLPADPDVLPQVIGARLQSSTVVSPNRDGGFQALTIEPDRP